MLNNVKINCSICEADGLKLDSIIDDKKQYELRKTRSGLIDYIKKLRNDCLLSNKYFIIECESQKQLFPKTKVCFTRFECSKRHEIIKEISDELPNL